MTGSMTDLRPEYLAEIGPRTISSLSKIRGSTPMKLLDDSILLSLGGADCPGLRRPLTKECELVFVDFVN